MSDLQISLTAWSVVWFAAANWIEEKRPNGKRDLFLGAIWLMLASISAGLM